MSSLTAPMNLFDQDLYTSSSTAKANLGALGQTADGRKFRYVKNGGVLMVVGKLQQSPAQDTSEQDLTPTATAIGATSLTTSSTVTVTANEYAGGFVMVTVTPGVGHAYRIKSHPAATAAAVTLELEDPIRVALTTTSRIDLVNSPYDGVIINPAASSGVTVGVAVHPIAVDEYGWIQSNGIVNCLADGTLTVGTNISASNAVAGAVEAAVTAQNAVGYVVTAITDTEYGPIFLTID